ncbi:hypothetical protein RR48_10641 [Papilio machaon]|uniref:Uncharacterized protein n=1 Tax=Papilio machaon TaxID=76193 RepID=A0A194RME3_PAPMA|nr:hypothetical protein RR48_10641 [Papilio machaon]
MTNKSTFVRARKSKSPEKVRLYGVRSGPEPATQQVCRLSTPRRRAFFPRWRLGVRGAGRHAQSSIDRREWRQRVTEWRRLSSGETRERSTRVQPPRRDARDAVIPVSRTTYAPSYAQEIGGDANRGEIYIEKPALS